MAAQSIGASAPLVVLAHGHPITTSKAVADFFHKQHKNVLRKIDQLLQELPPDFTKLNFELCYEINELQNDRPQPYYEITRDGFTLLAMGFTGSRALQWKIQYINAFNAMERELHGEVRPRQDPLFHVSADELAALVDQRLQAERHAWTDRMSLPHAAATIPSPADPEGLEITDWQMAHAFGTDPVSILLTQLGRQGVDVTAPSRWWITLNRLFSHHINQRRSLYKLAMPYLMAQHTRLDDVTPGRLAR